MMRLISDDSSFESLEHVIVGFWLTINLGTWIWAYRILANTKSF